MGARVFPISPAATYNRWTPFTVTAIGSTSSFLTAMVTSVGGASTCTNTSPVKSSACTCTTVDPALLAVTRPASASPATVATCSSSVVQIRSRPDRL